MSDKTCPSCGQKLAPTPQEKLLSYLRAQRDRNLVKVNEPNLSEKTRLRASRRVSRWDVLLDAASQISAKDGKATPS